MPSRPEESARSARLAIGTPSASSAVAASVVKRSAPSWLRRKCVLCTFSSTRIDRRAWRRRERRSRRDRARAAAETRARSDRRTHRRTSAAPWAGRSRSPPGRPRSNAGPSMTSKRACSQSSCALEPRDRQRLDAGKRRPLDVAHVVIEDDGAAGCRSRDALRLDRARSAASRGDRARPGTRRSCLSRSCGTACAPRRR